MDKSAKRVKQEIFASTRFGIVVNKIFARLNSFVYRLTTGHSVLSGSEISQLELITEGRVTKKQRAVMLYYTEVDHYFFIVASNFGRDKVPQWALNIEANAMAQVRIGQTVRKAVIRRLEPNMFNVLWRQLVRNIPMYEVYRQCTQREMVIYRIDYYIPHRIKEDKADDFLGER